MSDLLAKGAEVVRAAESSLRELIQTAVVEGQYDRVAVLARWAEQLAQIGGNGSDRANDAQDSAVSRHGRAKVSSGVKARRSSRGKRARSKYPIFRRSGDNLIKIAWSKASKSEYQHQSPKAVVLALLQKMLEAQNDDALITMDNVLPLSTNDQPEVPSYQSYACLAWLREIGVVEQHGRQGYSVVAEAAARELVETSWGELPIGKR